MPHPLTVAAVMASIAVAACAAPQPESELRVLVKLARASSDGEAIARRASDVSGVPVRYVAASSSQWHALALRCGDASRCDAAVARLSADTATFESVQRDERRRIMSP